MSIMEAKMKKTDLLIIDVQNDFCDPRGALFVQGADKDSLRLAEFIRKNSTEIHNIYITLDSHHNFDIAHPIYWIDDEGNHPEPFTIISIEDISSGVWKTTRSEDRDHGEKYVQSLKERGKYSLCIWPPHCLIGSWGTQIQDDVFKALNEWEIRNISQVRKILKGDNPGTEHYGAFEAEIPLKEDVSTQMRSDIIDKLKESETVIIAGQALDYCVANTVKQISKMAEKLVLLTDCCSSVDPASGLSDEFMKDMRKSGMKTAISTDFP